MKKKIKKRTTLDKAKDYIKELTEQNAELKKDLASIVAFEKVLYNTEDEYNAKIIIERVLGLNYNHKLKICLDIEGTNDIEAIGNDLTECFSTLKDIIVQETRELNRICDDLGVD